MEMNGLSILMFIFSALVFLAGLYIYTGHNSELLIWRGYNPHATKEQLKVIGRWTMIASGIIFAIGIIAMFLEV